MTVRVLNLYPLPESALARIRRIPGVEVETRTLPDGASVDELDLAGVDVLFGDAIPADPARAPRLRWLATAGAGVEHLDLPAFSARDVIVTNGSGMHASAMGEFCLGAILFASQRQQFRLAQQRAHAWRPREEALGLRLRGRTLAILGYGSIGREVARLASAFGIRVLAVKARPAQRADDGFVESGLGDPDGRIPERIVGMEGLHGVLAEAHYIVVALPLTPQTRGLIDATALAACRRDAWLVNIGRGPIVEEAALLDAVRGERLGGAYLDVFDVEPLPPEHPYWNEPRIVISPHVAGVNSMSEYWRLLAELLEEDLRRFIGDRPLLNRVDLVRAY